MPDALLRPPTTADLDAVLSLIRDCELDDDGEPETVAADVTRVWTRADFDISRDAWLIEEGGRAAGYAYVIVRDDGRRIEGTGYVHSDARGRGFGTRLLAAIAPRTRELAHPEGAVLGTFVNHANESARRLLEDHGYAAEKLFWQMRIDLTGDLPAPEWPEGVTVRTFRPGADDRAVYTLVQEGFADNYRNMPSPFDEWRHTMLEGETFDPALYFLAVAGGQIVAAALCPNYDHEGWVRQLVVRRDWRRRGLAAALLRHAFAEFKRRGHTTAGLTVDSYNRTGAKSVYEAAGMRVHRQYDGYDKPLRR
jgi:GNAT superfamily N-acetyltransferase